MLRFFAESPFMDRVQYVMKIVFIFVFVLFMDSLNRVIKVDEITENVPHHDHGSSLNIAARRFHAQRNMYLTGFTLFLSLILNRTFFMILDLLSSEEKMEVIKKQASQQRKEYDRVLDEVKVLSEIVAKHVDAKQEWDKYTRENSGTELKHRETRGEDKKDI